MKDYRLLLLSAFLLYGAYRYGLSPAAVKSDFPEHPVGRSPGLAVRLLGGILLVGALLLVYLFFARL